MLLPAMCESQKRCWCDNLSLGPLTSTILADLSARRHNSRSGRPPGSGDVGNSGNKRLWLEPCCMNMRRASKCGQHPSATQGTQPTYGWPVALAFATVDARKSPTCSSYMVLCHQAQHSSQAKPSHALAYVQQLLAAKALPVDTTCIHPSVLCPHGCQDGACVVTVMHMQGVSRGAEQHLCQCDVVVFKGLAGYMQQSGPPNHSCFRVQPSAVPFVTRHTCVQPRLPAWPSAIRVSCTSSCCLRAG